MAQAGHTHDESQYYIPHGSKLPFFGSIALFVLMAGAAATLNGAASGSWVLGVGFLLLFTLFFLWFGQVIRENQAGFYNEQVDRSFRMGMMWFIFSEVMFFAAFFGALFYARMYSIPWLGGEGHGAATNAFLWPEFTTAWPTNGPGEVGGHYSTMSPWGIPLLNTLLLLSSGVTITIAHHALRAGHRGRLLVFLALTVLLGAVFLGFQVYEYAHAYGELNLTLGSGIYGSTFFMLTGFHGMHVTLGPIVLAIIWFRRAEGHFAQDDHFRFDAVAGYWLFVDVVWPGVLLFVYVLEA